MNQQYLFNVKYYENLITRSEKVGYESLNRSIIETRYRQGREEIPLCAQSLAFEVMYPGILAGTGYIHEAGYKASDKNAEIKAGFSLDYVSGLPCIPGSTVKGILNSDFRRHSAYVETLLGCDSNTVDDLRKAIFENGEDVFLEAYPVKADKNERLLGLEYITPHKANDPRYNGLTGVNPIRMLKILPGVTILFRFLVGDTFIQTGGCNIKISADTKLKLFEKLLEEYGIGAKTNLGVGQLQRVQNVIDNYYWLCESDELESAENKTDISKSIPNIKNKNVLGICPICKKNILVGKSGKPYHSNCNLRFKKYYKTELTNDQICALLAGKEFTVYDKKAGKEIRIKQCGTEFFIDQYTGDICYRFKYKKV